jgi:hypothetical protein
VEVKRDTVRARGSISIPTTRTVPVTDEHRRKSPACTWQNSTVSIAAANAWVTPRGLFVLKRACILNLP